MDNSKIKIAGLKKAVGAYRDANSGGRYSQWHGKLMLDRETGELWTDEIYGRNNWREYHNPAITCLSNWMQWNYSDKWYHDDGKHGYVPDYRMTAVRAAAEECIRRWREEHDDAE